MGACYNFVINTISAVNGDYGKYLQIKLREDGRKSDVFSRMCRVAYNVYSKGDKETYKKIKADIISENYCSEERFVKKMKEFEKKEKLSAEREAFDEGKIDPKKVSDELIKEKCEKEIAKASKLLFNGKKDEAKLIIKKVAEKYGFSENRIKVFASNKAQSY